MSLPPEPWSMPVRVVILAGQRRGVAEPLAERAGVSHKCLVPIAGQPLLMHVVRTARGHPSVSSVVVSIEEKGFAGVRKALGAASQAVELVAAADNIADSVNAAAENHPGPIIVTTADNVLLRPDSLDAVLTGLKGSDAIVAMAPREAVLAAHPVGQRRFYEFSDGGYSNCNLYGLNSRSALAAAESFRSGGQFAKNVWRIAKTFGLINLLLLRFRLVSLDRAFRRISKRIGLRVSPIVLLDGSQAIDVDNGRTFAIAEDILRNRNPWMGATRPVPLRTGSLLRLSA